MTDVQKRNRKRLEHVRRIWGKTQCCFCKREGKDVLLFAVVAITHPAYLCRECFNKYVKGAEQ